MRISRRPLSWPLIGLGALLGFVALGLDVSPLAGETPVRLGEGVPPDVARLGLIVDEAPGEIVRVSAVNAALEVGKSVAPAAKVVPSAYLLRVTDPHWVDTANPLEDRTVWLVRYDGVDISFPAPPAADGTEVEGHTAHFVYALVDATTGEIIDIQYWE